MMGMLTKCCECHFLHLHFISCHVGRNVRGNRRARAVEATGFLLQIKSFKFPIILPTFDRLLTYTKSLSDCLQHTHVDLAKPADLVSATMSTLESF